MAFATRHTSALNPLSLAQCSMEMRLEMLEHADFFAPGAKHRAVVNGVHMDVDVPQRWFHGSVGMCEGIDSLQLID
jgi:hypothetical protein